MSGFIEPVELMGERWVSLEPLTPGHVEEIVEASADVRELWFTSAPTPSTTREWLDGRLAVQGPDTGLTFVVRAKDGQLIGSSSYCNVDAPNRRLEIGYTWYRQSVRRTGVNTECKLLMLAHAFGELNCVAVEFRTDFFNSTSRAAIERVGGKRDGILRSHQVRSDGSRRDTVVYSILDVEWPAVRNNLQFRLDR